MLRAERDALKRNEEEFKRKEEAYKRKLEEEAKVRTYILGAHILVFFLWVIITAQAVSLT